MSNYMSNYVMCPACDVGHDSSEVETLNIEEDFQGRDVLTFQCPYSNTVQKSLVYRGSYVS